MTLFVLVTLKFIPTDDKLHTACRPVHTQGEIKKKKVKKLEILKYKRCREFILNFVFRLLL